MIDVERRYGRPKGVGDVPLEHDGGVEERGVRVGKG